MSDQIHLVDEASLLVPSLKQCVLVKIAETLIRPDLERFCFINCFVSDKPLQRISDSFKQLRILESCQNDIRGVIWGLYRHFRDGTIRFSSSIAPSSVKYNTRGDVDMDKTFDDCMEDICRWPRTPRKYLMIFLKDACRYHQEQCVHAMLCELAKWDRSGLEPYLRNATPEVEVVKYSYFWRSEIRFAIEDLVDPAPWQSFVTMLNNNVDGRWIRFFLRGNIIVGSMEKPRMSNDLVCMWPKMTTIRKYEQAATFFKAALDESDTCLLVRSMHYLDSTNRMHLIKTNLVSFILCFLTHPYYKDFLPDLQLVDEDLKLVQKENEVMVFKQLLRSHDWVEDYTNISDCLIELWKYVSSRDKSLGDHVHRNIKAFLNENVVRSGLEKWNSTDAKKTLETLYEIFPTEQ